MFAVFLGSLAALRRIVLTRINFLVREAQQHALAHWVREDVPMGMARRQTALGCLFVGAFTAAMAGVARAGDDPVADGQAIVEQNCARCHAVGTSGESTHKDAPPFRVVVTRYPPETLAEALGEGISTGHPDMPVFTFEPDEIAAIISYLETLQQPGTPPVAP